LLKTINRDIKFIQSFADGRLGCGTIYKAANFKYFGFNKSLFFKDIETGEVFHKVPLENTKRPFGFLIKNRRYVDGKLNAFYVKTYRYIYPLYKNRYKIKLNEMSYPEYEKGIEEVKYKHSIGLLCRLFLMYEAINDKEYADKTFSILQQNFSSNNIIKELEAQKENKSYIWFLKNYLNNDSNLKKLKH
jgi:hypothetical protein